MVSEDRAESKCGKKEESVYRKYDYYDIHYYTRNYWGIFRQYKDILS